MRKIVRIATRLEVKHYHELIRRLQTLPIDQVFPQAVRGRRLGARTVAVLAELDRFGYIPTKDALLVVMDEAVPDPLLTSEQALAVQADLAYLWRKLS
jgi:hypothetical protein